MAARERPPRPRGREPGPRRPGRLVSWPLYRVLLVVSLAPALLAVLTLREPDTPSPPVRPLEFDGAAAATLAAALPPTGEADAPTPAALDAADWVAARLAEAGLRPRRRPFAAAVPWQADPVPMVNVTAVDRGRSRELVAVVAHRDPGPDGRDNAAATGILLQLARELASGRLERGILFASTDGGAAGARGAERLAEDLVLSDRIVAAVVLDDLSLRPGTALAISTTSGAPRGPSPTLVAAARQAAIQPTAGRPRMPRALAQIADYGIPYAPDEEGPLLAHGVSAVRISAADPAAGEGIDRLDPAGMELAGIAVASLVTGLAEPGAIEPGGDPAVFVGAKVMRGWLVRLAVAALLLAPLACVLQVAVRCRRGRIPLGGGIAAAGWRAATGVAAVASLWVVSALPGHLLSRADVPPLPGRTGATATGVALAAAFAALFWRFVSRPRLAPYGRPTPTERSAGFAGALVVLMGAGLLLTAVNPFALVVLLPAAHAWLWIPAAGRHGLAAMLAVYAAGYLGVVAVVAHLWLGTPLGAEAPEALVAMTASGYLAPAVSLCLAVAAGAAAQLCVLLAGRYAPSHPPPRRV